MNGTIGLWAEKVSDAEKANKASLARLAEHLIKKHIREAQKYGVISCPGNRFELWVADVDRNVYRISNEGKGSYGLRCQHVPAEKIELVLKISGSVDQHQDGRVINTWIFKVADEEVGEEVGPEHYVDDPAPEMFANYFFDSKGWMLPS